MEAPKLPRKKINKFQLKINIHLKACTVVNISPNEKRDLKRETAYTQK